MQDSVLPQGCGGGVAPTSSHHPFYRFYPFYPFKFPLRRFVTFSKISSIFRLLKTFLSYQQVINNAGFSTQVFEKFSENRSILGALARLC